uniref:Uncharacterized protein n=1 Tax=Solanum lycopersicum TaxID=4081 RepID=K4AW37_SOLLC
MHAYLKIKVYLNDFYLKPLYILLLSVYMPPMHKVKRVPSGSTLISKI